MSCPRCCLPSGKGYRAAVDDYPQGTNSIWRQTAIYDYLGDVSSAPARHCQQAHCRRVGQKERRGNVQVLEADNCQVLPRRPLSAVYLQGQWMRG